MRTRACGAILRNDTVLMVHHVHDGRAYWTLPGGGVEPGETPSAAAVREMREETGVNATVVRFLFRESAANGSMICDCFLLTANDDQQAALGFDPEEAARAADTRMLQDVAWLPLSGLTNDAQIVKVLAALAESAPDE